MRKNKIENRLIVLVASTVGVPLVEARRAINSFFDLIVLKAKALPFDNECRIYSRQAFGQKGFAINIPYLGRIGPVYSRYLRWRANASKDQLQENRGQYRSRISEDDIEHIAERLLSGRPLPPIKKTKGKDIYKRVWFVDENGKRLARQIIRKEKK